MLSRRTAIALSGVTLAMPAIAQSRTKVRLAGGGIALYGYMPYFVAMNQKLFQKNGIEPEEAMFSGGAKALQALMGGSSDVVCGFYEHTILMAAKDAKLTAFVLQAQNSGLVLGVRQQLANEIKTVADLKGRKIGVSAPGSATHVFAQIAMVKAGLKANDAAAIGVGTTQTAVSSFERGDVDALSMFDPIVAALERKHEIAILADARDTKGTQAIFGGPYASGCLYAERGWMEKNEGAVRGCAAAIAEAVRFLKQATPQQAIDALAPGMCFIGADICQDAFTSNRGAFDHDGQVTAEMSQTVYKALAGSDPAVASAKIDLPATYTGRFVGA